MRLPDAIRRAALFPEADLPAPPPGHPTRRVSLADVFVRLPVGLPFALASPERIDESSVEQVVDEVRRFVGSEGRQGLFWFVPDEPHLAGLGERLRRLGMRPSDFAGMESRQAAMAAVDAPRQRPSGVVARRVASFDEFLAAQRLIAESLDLDATVRRAFEERAERLWPFESADGDGATYVAVLDGEVVAYAGALFGATAVYLGGGVTRPEHRGRGAYTALVHARWQAAVERGTPALTVSAGTMSRPILERLGFSIVGWFDCLLDEL